MLRRTRATDTSALTEQEAVSAFRWSIDTGNDGRSHVLDGPHFKSAAAARAGWEQHRRAVWDSSHRFTVPAAASVYDKLSLGAVDAIRSAWPHDGPFREADVLEVLAMDRANLERFAATAGAQAIADFLQMLRDDLGNIEQTAHDLAAVPVGLWRPYPQHLASADTYGESAGKDSQP